MLSKGDRQYPYKKKIAAAPGLCYEFDVCVPEEFNHGT